MKRQNILIFAVVGLVGVVALSVFGIKYTSKPEFCTTCHEVRPAVSSWRVGAHSDVDCLKCHADPGVIGKVKVKVGGLQEVYVHLTHRPTSDELVADVPASRCLHCHENDFYFKDENLTKIHESQTISCGPCHRQDIHKGI